jgi:hypothetical protein
MYRPIDHGIGYYSAVVRRRLPGLRRTRAGGKEREGEKRESKQKIEKGRERKDTDTPETKGDGERAEQEKSTGAARLGQQKP